MPTPTFLVTGAAGFIGAHVAAELRARGLRVTGCDNFNAYYDPTLKFGRVDALLDPVGVRCERVDIADPLAVQDLFDRLRPAVVVHLAAQAGVRHSLSHPQDYVQSNLVGTANVLEAARRTSVAHLLYASSSSVYGQRARAPFRESLRTDAPVSLYAATKKSAELMAHAYAHLHGLRATGLRLFTVYGPWGRPDMAYFSFTRKMLAREPVPVYGGGTLQRDFTYVDDAVQSIVRLALSAPRRRAPGHEVFNIGSRCPVTVLDFVHLLGQALDINPRIEFLPMQPGDVPMTCADTSRLRSRIGFEPSTPLREGLERFVSWYRHWMPRPQSGAMESAMTALSASSTAFRPREAYLHDPAGAAV